ncbi:3-phenylpropionate/trans-cinnamate dioxygenase ferredoxin reductase subunit [Pseudonocardia kunmingensis]|uniref:3-phenylpropionate/trans-cinnamate dioxygenase ferredoxin reductase subunit n=1 Tax=Pseudonocardia kunmingensis TaxID=630975 RepID=A0A543CWZ9_9PSEU|nr:3-phenylpropionate/trans-cinnamate dioxygenase ferredoxin reductase subunit [Pseudonocardia kunmingensis]
MVVGGGQAAAQVAVSLRQAGYASSLTIVGDEPLHPYMRPPVSKAYLRGGLGTDRLTLRPPALYQKLEVEVRTRACVRAVDRDRAEIRLDDGERLGYDHLVLATGAVQRPLPFGGAGSPTVHALRTVEDADRLRPHLRPGRRLVIVGAGYVGMEVASVATGLGVAVTVLEAADRVLARVAGHAVSEHLTALHRAAGVEVVTGVAVSTIDPTNGTTGSVVTCHDGRRWQADLVLVAIGVLPRVELAEAAGIRCADGIAVDEVCRTTDPQIYAAGDCTNAHNPLYGRRIRLESVSNAVEQGKTVAAAITGRTRPTERVPWFWSDQYDVKLQTVGLLTGHATTVLRGNPVDGSFAVLYADGDGRVIAVDAVNAPREFSLARLTLGRAAACLSFPTPDDWPPPGATADRS